MGFVAYSTMGILDLAADRGLIRPEDAVELALLLARHWCRTGPPNRSLWNGRIFRDAACREAWHQGRHESVPARDSIRDELEPALAHVKLTATLEPDLDFIHGFARSKSRLREDFPAWKRHLAKSGCVWVSWPKKMSGLETDLTDTVVREVGLNAGLVDTKVCAIDDQWSGLKFVYRNGDR
jgi:hypothetical protein